MECLRGGTVKSSDGDWYRQVFIDIQPSVVAVLLVNACATVTACATALGICATVTGLG
jgi:hypothetical protein